MNSKPYLLAGMYSILLGLLAVYYGVGLTQAYGSTYDEALYMVTGQAIAEGKGYRLISQPGDPYQVLYPPAYPLALAAVWLVHPIFPDNVLAMKWLNIVFALVAVVATYFWVVHSLCEPRWKGVLSALFLALSGGVLLILNFAMSEVMFMSVTIVTLCWGERRLAERKGVQPTTVVALASLAGLATMTRTIGIALGAAMVAKLLLLRAWKPAALMGAAVVAFNLPWVLFTVWAARSGGPVLPGYMEAIALRTDNFNPLKVLAIPVTNSGIFWDNVSLMLAGLLHHAWFTHGLARVGLGFLAPLLSVCVLGLILAGVIVTWRRQCRVFHLYLTAYVGILLIYPFPPYTRFVAVLLPVLAYCLTEGLALVLALPERWPDHARWLRPTAGAFVAAITLVTVGLSGYRVVGWVSQATGAAPALRATMPASQTDQEATMRWAKAHLPAEALWISECDPCTYMATGRKSLVYRDGAQPSAASRAQFNRQPTFMIVYSQDSASQRWFRELAAAHPGRVKLVYQAPAKTIKVYQLAMDWPLKDDAN